MQAKPRACCDSGNGAVINGVANNIPSGVLVEITIVSHNEAGDAQPSAPVSALMPEGGLTVE